MKEYQLRIYDVAEGKMDEFLAVFPKVVAARRDAGFEVVGAWTIAEQNQFVWIVGADDSTEDASIRYYESPLRKAIQPEPASLLANVDTRVMRPVPGV